jgi:hypothetical protein
MDEELKQTEDRTKEIERLMEELKSEREDLVRRSGVIRSARAIFFSDQTKAKATPQGSAVSDEQILRAVTGIEADKFQYLSIGQAILAVLKYNENKWTPISEFAAEFKKRGKNVSYASIDQTIRGSKLSEKLENKKEGNRNFFRLKQ